MSDLSIEEGHAIITKAQKPHSMAIEKAIQVFALKGLAMPTLLA
jgi:predicted HAD superfamily phosphohydrolase YqeG